MSLSAAASPADVLKEERMITPYDNAFSPFARKVRLALVLEGIERR